MTEQEAFDFFDALLYSDMMKSGKGAFYKGTATVHLFVTHGISMEEAEAFYDAWVPYHEAAMKAAAKSGEESAKT